MGYLDFSLGAMEIINFALRTNGPETYKVTKAKMYLVMWCVSSLNEPAKFYAP